MALIKQDCAVCLSQETIHRCYNCYLYVCVECIKEHLTDDKNRCLTCRVCDNAEESSNYSECDICSQLVCSECDDGKRDCSKCKKLVCIECYEEIEGNIICSECKKEKIIKENWKRSKN